jgi:uncharacterized membrane protein
MPSDRWDISVAAFATAVAALMGGIFWAANDLPDAEIAWGIAVLAAAYGLWRWRQRAQRRRARD